MAKKPHTPPKTVKADTTFQGMKDKTDLGKMLKEHQTIVGDLSKAGLPDLADLKHALENKTNPDPWPDIMLDVGYTGNAEIDARSELDVLSSAMNIVDGLEPPPEEDARPDEVKKYVGAANRAVEQYVHGTETNFWIAIVFRSQEQKDILLKHLNLFHIHDRYFDGLKFAASLGVKLPRVQLVQADKKPVKRLMEFVDEELVGDVAHGDPTADPILLAARVRELQFANQKLREELAALKAK